MKFKKKWIILVRKCTCIRLYRNTSIEINARIFYLQVKCIFSVRTLFLVFFSKFLFNFVLAFYIINPTNLSLFAIIILNSTYRNQPTIFFRFRIIFMKGLSRSSLWFLAIFICDLLLKASLIQLIEPSLIWSIFYFV